MTNIASKNRELLSIFYIFLKISGLTLGGGYAMIPAIERNLINKKLITEKEFFNLLSIAQSMPGPIAFNLSILLGRKLRGFWGAVFASFGVIIPPFFGIIIVASLIQVNSGSVYVAKFLNGCYIATVGLTSYVLYKMMKNINYNKITMPLFLFGVLFIILNKNLTFFVFLFLVLINYFYEKRGIDC
ncbi:MAG: chromate transporter [Methanofastidiosum sp.]|jgi:chromate transporter|nr:chromate transporter [Methanofastidiosum sp.]